ncbi:hypothetical protein [Ketobacter alkanivorans]|uniref:Glycosyltransferase 2-like domain-containing protein n=1 Tax=Ketobacter alkanivorans TaxID=1917421 RepID=A0A2K9LMT3_9GAMM|nr:hypothetical protein [Ketobacter alkanivorans]AUM13451.1 hypothetical protein Kalk_13920 [Ketobacter alkanivorans]
MLHYFLKKRLKKHDENNNIRLKSMMTMLHLEQSAIARCGSGIGNDCAQNIVVSLTSYEKRIDELYLCIESLFRQSLKADRVILWLSVKNFPGKDLPRTLLSQCEKGLEIRFIEDDLGPYKKIIYTLDECPESLVITVDDDVLYPVDMVEKLYRSYLLSPAAVHCHRAYRMRVRNNNQLEPYKKWDVVGCEGQTGIDIFPTGIAGVLYPPGSLHRDVLDVNLFMRLCPGADDVWLKAMSLLAGSLSSKVEDSRSWKSRFLTIEGSQAQSLKRDNWKPRNGNDSKINAVFGHYDLYRFLCV